MYVHKIILITFIGPCPKGMGCRHFPDPNPANNSLANLQWGTPKQNSLDMIKHGRSTFGIKNKHAKLSPAQIVEIKSLKGKLPNKEIAKIFQVGESAIRKILTGENWRCLENGLN